MYQPFRLLLLPGLLWLPSKIYLSNCPIEIIFSLDLEHALPPLVAIGFHSAILQ